MYYSGRQLPWESPYIQEKAPWRDRGFPLDCREGIPDRAQTRAAMCLGQERNPCTDSSFQFIPHVTIDVKKKLEVGIISRSSEVKLSVLGTGKSNEAMEEQED